MKWSPQPKEPCTRPDCDKPQRQWGYCEPHSHLWRRWGVPYRRDEQDEMHASNSYEREMDAALAADPPVIVWTKDQYGVKHGLVLFDPHTERANRKAAS